MVFYMRKCVTVTTTVVSSISTGGINLLIFSFSRSGKKTKRGV